MGQRPKVETTSNTSTAKSSDINNTVATLQNQVKQLEAKLEGHLAENSSHRKQNDKLGEEVKDLTSRNEKLEASELAELREQLALQAEERAALEGRVAQLEERVTDLEEEMETRRSEFEEERDRLNEEISNERDEVDEAYERACQRREACDVLEVENQRNKRKYEQQIEDERDLRIKIFSRLNACRRKLGKPEYSLEKLMDEAYSDGDDRRACANYTLEEEVKGT